MRNVCSVCAQIVFHFIIFISHHISILHAFAKLSISIIMKGTTCEKKSVTGQQTSSATVEDVVVLRMTALHKLLFLEK